MSFLTENIINRDRQADPKDTENPEKTSKKDWTGIFVLAGLVLINQAVGWQIENHNLSMGIATIKLIIYLACLQSRGGQKYKKIEFD